jgi:hypothetical protein
MLVANLASVGMETRFSSKGSVLGVDWYASGNVLLSSVLGGWRVASIFFSVQPAGRPVVRGYVSGVAARGRNRVTGTRGIGPAAVVFVSRVGKGSGGGLVGCGRQGGAPAKRTGGSLNLQGRQREAGNTNTGRGGRCKNYRTPRNPRERPPTPHDRPRDQEKDPGSDVCFWGKVVGGTLWPQIGRGPDGVKINPSG